MKSVVFTQKNEVSVSDIADPQAGPGEVVVDVQASGICHTDLEVLRGNYGTSAFPVTPGHEYAGVIAQTGAGVEHLKVGDRVVVDPNIECGECSACKRGWAHLCESLGAYGVTIHGGFAEKSLVHSSAAHHIGDMPFHIAALAEPLGCVLNGLEAASAKKAKSAIIFGAGPIGLLLAIGMQVQGVSDISLVDINQDRLKLAQSFGFKALASNGDELKSLHQSIDLVADATGVPAVAQTLTTYAANGGTCLFFGVCPADAKIDISPFEIFRRQLSLVGSHSLNHNIPDALAALRAYGDDIGRLVSHQMDFDGISETMRGAPPQGSLKIQWTKSAEET